MPAAVAILDQAGEELGSFLPRLAGALGLLVVGLVAAWLIGRILTRVLQAAGVDALSERFGASHVTERAGLGRSFSRLIGRAVRLGLSLVVIFAALSLLGLQVLSDSLNAAVLFLPNLAVAALLLLVGVVLGGLARERVDRLVHQMDLPISLGLAAQATVIAIFAITAAAQIAVATAILMVLVGILLSGVVATLALAFGLGGRELARELNTGRSLRGSYEPGQIISFGDVRGEIVTIETAATVLRTDAQETVRVPNHLLFGSIVTVHEPPVPESPG
jgi:small-conductance mechanosensitive channel